MSNSPNLALPYIAASQAQKHVTHNDAVALLDGLLQLSVISRSLATPPASFADGNRFLVAASPSGDWVGQAGMIALRNAGQWQFLTPRKGFVLWVEAESLLLVFDGVNWAPPPPPQALQNLTLLGVNATADATNKLAVSSAAALFSHVGNGVQVKLNKNAAGDTASLLYQTGFSGRAELGTAGDDGFHLKVSADGAAWKEALVVDAATGLAKAYADPATALGLATKQYVDAGTNGIANARLAPMPAATLKGNSTGTSATPADLTVAQVKALLALSTADVSGLGALASASAVNLATQTTGTLQAAQFGTLSGDVVNTGFAVTIAANAITNAKAAPMPAMSFKANATASAASPQDLGLQQMQAALNLAGLTAARHLIMN